MHDFKSNSQPQASVDSENQQPITVLSSTTNNQSQPPAAGTQEISTVDVFSPENDGKNVEAQVQSATSTSPPVATEQNSNKFAPQLGTLKQQWPLLAAISMAAVTSLGLLWKYAVRIGV